MSLIKTGKFTANGSTVKLDLGFVPDYFKIFNANAAAGEVAAIEWFNQLGATKEFQTVIVVDNGVTGNANHVYNTASAEISATVEGKAVQTTNPIKVYGDRGVQIDETFMEDSDVLYFVAIASDRDEDLGDAANWTSI